MTNRNITRPQDPSTDHKQPFSAEYEPGKPNSVYPENYVNYELAPGEYLLKCPYDSSHRIRPLRMGNHIVKCRKNYEKLLRSKNMEVRNVTCPWTPGHIVPEAEIQYHATQCNLRAKGRNEVTNDVIPVQRSSYNGEVQTDEDWEPEITKYKSTYNPTTKIECEPIFYIPKGMCKGDKKKFKELQRTKFYHLTSSPFWEGRESARAKSPSSSEASGTAATTVTATANFAAEPFMNRLVQSRSHSMITKQEQGAPAPHEQLDPK